MMKEEIMNFEYFQQNIKFKESSAVGPGKRGKNILSKSYGLKKATITNVVVK